MFECSINKVHENTGGTYAVVQHTGWIRFLHYTVDVTPCGIDLRNFPFDEQYCLLKIGTANVGMSIIDIYPKGKVEYSVLDPRFNNEWHVSNRKLNYPEGKICYVMFYFYHRKWRTVAKILEVILFALISIYCAI